MARSRRRWSTMQRMEEANLDVMRTVREEVVQQGEARHTPGGLQGG
ncbi:hypothetical protein HKW98_14175 [Stutzerimonas urumqiensis]